MDYRFGTEYEGAFRDQLTLIVPHAADHNVKTVLEVCRAHSAHPTHLWLEAQPGESLNWQDIADLVEDGFFITVQVRDKNDLPMETDDICKYMSDGRASLVWMVPKELHALINAVDWIKVVHGPGPFDGYEIAASQVSSDDDNIRFFPARLYAEDQVWPRK